MYIEDNWWSKDIIYIVNYILLFFIFHSFFLFFLILFYF